MTSHRTARRTLLQLTFLLSLITYLDRVAIGTAVPAIRDELHLSPSQIAWTFSAFTFAYAIFEIPTGWMGDRFGARNVLTRVVVWWSVFTALTGAVWSVPSLIVTRFLFGAGEAGAFPNISRSFFRWFPARERGAAHGVMFLGSRVGGAVAPPLVVLVTTWFGWRAAFWIFGAVGIVWAVIWHRWFRDFPADHPSVSRDELAEIAAGLEPDRPAVRLRSFFSLNLFLVCLMYFCWAYGLYFWLTWLPTYFKEARGFTTAQAAWLSSMVLVASALATWTGGKLTDWLVRTRGLRVGRAVGAVAMPLGGVVLIAAALSPNAMASAVLFALAAAAADLCLSASWAICHDIGGESAGTVTGAMNMFGNFGGMLSPLVVGYALQWGYAWHVPLLIGGAVYVLGGLLVLAIDPRNRLSSAG